MSKELPKVYEPQEVEARIYEAWEQAGCCLVFAAVVISQLPERRK